MSEPNNEPTIGTGPGQVPADGVAPTGNQTLRIIRQNLFKTAKQTMDFIDDSEKDRKVKVRVDDQRSALFLILSLVMVVLTIGLLIINVQLRPICIVLGILADVLLGMSVVWYVLLRFGILRKLDPRYAVLCFQLLLGTGMLFAYFAFNVVLIFLSFVFKIPGVTVPM